MRPVETPMRPVRLVEGRLEVLPVVPDDEARYEDECGDDGQLLRDLALALDDPRLVMIPHAREQIAGDVELFGDTHERLVRVGEEALDLRWKERVVAYLDPSVQDPPDCRARRRNGPPAVEKLVPEIR